jgi:hypothetical protein
VYLPARGIRRKYNLAVTSFLLYDFTFKQHNIMTLFMNYDYEYFYILINLNGKLESGGGRSLIAIKAMVLRLMVNGDW